MPVRTKTLPGATGVTVAYAFGKIIQIDDANKFKTKIKKEKSEIRNSDYTSRGLTFVMVDTIEINEAAEKLFLAEIKEVLKNNAIKLTFVTSRRLSKDVRKFIVKAKKELKSSKSTAVEIIKDRLRLAESLETISIIAIGLAVVIYGDTRQVYDIKAGNFNFKVNSIMIIGAIITLYPWIIKPAINPFIAWLTRKLSK